MVIETPCGNPSGSRISNDRLLLIGLVGSPPLRLPEATKIDPLASVCTDGYQRAVSSLLPGSNQSWPSRLGFPDERVRYLKPLKPLRMVGSSQAIGPLPPTESRVPFARNVPPYELTGRQCWVLLLQCPFVVQQVLYLQEASSKSGPQRPSGRKLTLGLTSWRPTIGSFGPQSRSQLRFVNQAAVGCDGHKLTNCLEGISDLDDSLGGAWGVDSRKLVERN